MGIAIVIPTMGRAGRIPALKAVQGAILCPPAAEAEEYKKAHPGVEIVAHPDSVKGLSLKRQWIYKKFGDVFMLDDDVTYVQRMYLDIGEKPYVARVDPIRATTIINNTAEMCREMGAYLFGLNPACICYAYRSSRPFRLSGYVNGCGIGLLKGSKIFFDARCVAVEDMWASSINAYYHRYCFVDMRFGLRQQATFGNAGGLANQRRSETEIADTEFLKKTFGKSIIDKNFSSNARGGQTAYRLPIGPENVTSLLKR